jgi:hypothetical protein
MCLVVVAVAGMLVRGGGMTAMVEEVVTAAAEEAYNGCSGQGLKSVFIFT